MSSIPEEIIIRSFQKTASTEEMQSLNDWLREDKKNVEYYFQLEEIWSTKEKLPEKFIHNSWERISREIEDRPQHKEKPLLHKNTRNYMWLRYVAAVFIGVLITSVIWMTFSTGLMEQDQDIFVQNVVYNRTGVETVLLPDSSVIWINENTKITYPGEFEQKQRIVSLEGKAYFDIYKNPDKPFILKVGNLDIEVTGTEFFVESLLEGDIFVTLISGGVNLNYKENNSKKTLTSLVPGQQAQINPANGDVKITGVDTSYYVAWKDGTYRFNDEPLEDIAGLMAKHFGLDIQMSETIKKKRFTGRITPEEKIEEVLLSIHKSHPIKYTITGKTVHISEL